MRRSAFAFPHAARFGGSILLCALPGVVLSAADALTRQLGDALAKKVVLVQDHATQGVKKPLATTVSQAETNSYLKFNAGDLLPTGLTQPEITMHGKNRVSGKAIVDLDVVRRKQSSGGWLGRTSSVTGEMRVTAAGTLITAHGTSRF